MPDGKRCGSGCSLPRESLSLASQQSSIPTNVYPISAKPSSTSLSAMSLQGVMIHLAASRQGCQALVQPSWASRILSSPCGAVGQKISFIPDKSMQKPKPSSFTLGFSLREGIIVKGKLSPSFHTMGTCLIRCSDMHPSGSDLQSVLQRNLSQESQPIGGNNACPFCRPSSVLEKQPKMMNNVQWRVSMTVKFYAACTRWMIIQVCDCTSPHRSPRQDLYTAHFDDAHLSRTASKFDRAGQFDRAVNSLNLQGFTLDTVANLGVERQDASDGYQQQQNAVVIFERNNTPSANAWSFIGSKEKIGLHGRCCGAILASNTFLPSSFYGKKGSLFRCYDTKHSARASLSQGWHALHFLLCISSRQSCSNLK